jgi:hypothetical protein
MAWERSFETRVLKIRDRELRYQQLNYMIEVRIISQRNYNSLLTFDIQTLWNAIWYASLIYLSYCMYKCRFFHRNGSPILVTLVAFWHFAVYRGQVLTPSIAFTSISGE